MRPNSLFARIVASTALLLIIPAAQAQDRPEIEIVPQIRHGSGVRVVAFSPDGAQVLSGGYDKSLKLWDATTGRLLRSFEGHSDEVTSVAFSPGTGRLIGTFEGHSGGVTSVAFSPDGTRVVSGSRDKTLKLWDVATGRLIGTFEGHSDSIQVVAFSPDGARVLSSGGDKTLKLWDVASRQVIRTFEGDSDYIATVSVAFSADGTRVLSGSWSMSVPCRS